MYREYLSEIVGKLNAMHVKSAWHSYKNLPSDHCYTTYFVPLTKFNGDDLRAQCYDYTVLVAFFFRQFFDITNDGAIEREFEESVREYSKFKKTCGYDNIHDQFYTIYEFNFKEFFEED